MIVNGASLLTARPIIDMEPTKCRAHGLSYGLSECGYDIRIAQDMWLHPLRRFRLASSIERFDMPQTIMGVCHDKSSNIRRGLLVGNSVLEPGWRGWLTLELFFFGWRPLYLRAGTPIAQVIFHRITERASYAGGKYDEQPARPVAAIMEGGA